MRCHKDPSRRQLKPGRQLKPRRPPQPRQSPQPPQARGHCTRYVAVHPLRGGAPEQKRCIAYGSGAVPQHTRTNAELAHRTTHRHTPPCATGPYWRQDGHAAHATTCTPAHSDPIRHLLHPYMRRARYPRRFRLPTARFHVWPCTIGPQQRQEPPENGRARVRNGTQRRRHDPLGKDADEPHRSTEGYIHSQSRTPSVVATGHYRLMA